MRESNDFGEDFSFDIPSPTPEGTERMKAIIEEKRGSAVSDAEAEDALRRIITIPGTSTIFITNLCVNAEILAARLPARESWDMNQVKQHVPSALAERRAQRIQRIRKTMAVKRAAGQVTGRLPLGYCVSRVNGVSVAVEDPDTMKLLAEAKEMQVRGVSIRAIRRYLTEKGFRGRSGKPISVAGLWRILT